METRNNINPRPFQPVSPGCMYEKLYEWLQNNKDSMEEIHKFSTWQKVFDEIGGTYERVWSKEELDQGYLNN